ncbi:MAG TPA: 7TM-DISM domain-containing protein [Oligoflexus sp.]|uniref:7TM-DISM domain-containing protein n=1 Tax=Oligoflexus sp. TaxID=1971216 RepID=UPI002D7F4075|nr:7TM-DISM domain-containing protein [Oligoflexus sp.]HET9237871.1 7TM-DISM domain-containing protein [Oligoflexus sp.]
MTRRFSKQWSRLQALLIAMTMGFAPHALAADWMQHVPVPSLELQDITSTIEVQLTSEYRSIKAYDRHLSIDEMLTEISKEGALALTGPKVTIRESGYYILVSAIHNNTGEDLKIAQYEGVVIEKHSFLVTDGKVEALPRRGLLGHYFIIPLKPGKNYIVTSVKNDYKVEYSTTFVRFSDLETVLGYDDSKKIIIPFFFGAILLILVHTIWIYFSFRKFYFLFYSLYVASAFYFFLMSYGFFFPFSLVNGAIAACLSSAFLLAFCRYFLASRIRNIRFIGDVLILVAIASAIYSYVARTMGFSVLVPLASISFFTFASIRAALAGYKPATYLSVGTLVLTLSLAALALEIYVQIHPLLAHCALFGFMFEIVFFTLAILSKITLQEKRAKEESDHAFKQLSKVFYPHQIKQIRQAAELEQTMPTGSGKACVISFDIIGSSRIHHEKAKDFFRNVFLRCNEIMMEGYDGTELRANAYRIKELGDGFLCSVGFPFKSRTGYIARDTLELAYKFYEAFQDEVQKLGYHEPICCGIGIAFDDVIGFYPESGTKEYDLHGRAIVLATRYENMRKKILRDMAPSSIIILHEKVRASLQRESLEGFVEYCLQDHGAVVRDDPAATRLFYKFLRPDDVLEENSTSRSA